MTLSLIGETNKSYLMVNGLVFHMRDGEDVDIGWDSVSYYIDEDGKIEATMKALYVWDEDAADGDGEVSRYLTEHDLGRFGEASIEEMFIDMDAPEDYYIQFEGFRIY